MLIVSPPLIAPPRAPKPTEIIVSPTMLPNGSPRIIPLAIEFAAPKLAPIITDAPGQSTDKAPSAAPNKPAVIISAGLRSFPLSMAFEAIVEAMFTAALTTAPTIAPKMSPPKSPSKSTRIIGLFKQYAYALCPRTP